MLRDRAETADGRNYRWDVVAAGLHGDVVAW
jgi:hypothetical protein